jgi:hypothetical protein
MAEIEKLEFLEGQEYVPGNKVWVRINDKEIQVTVREVRADGEWDFDISLADRPILGLI